MIYRPIGNTGMEASIIGLGCEHLDNQPYELVKEVIDASLENDINMIDVFVPGAEVRENIGKALGSRRKDVLLQGHIGSVDINKQYDICRDVDICRKYFEDLMRYLKTDYIDFGMMFFIDSEEDFKGVFDTGFVTYVENLKKAGTIRAIGASSHNPVIAQKVVETGIVDLLMFSINLAYDMTPGSLNVLDSLREGDFAKSEFDGIDPDRYALYKLCESKGVGINVMKTYGSGKLLSPEHTPFEKPLTTTQCIHYALTRPAVSSVLLGFEAPEHVDDAMKYLTATDAEKDYTHALGSLKSTFKGKCVYCNHCQPCPSGIDIAALTKYLDIAQLKPEAIPPSVVQHYRGLAHKGGECIQCGSCEQRCPFGVPIIENMSTAAKLFGE